MEVAKFNAKIIKQNFIHNAFHDKKVVLKKRTLFGTKTKNINFVKQYVLDVETFEPISQNKIEVDKEYYLFEVRFETDMLNLIRGMKFVRNELYRTYDNVYLEDIIRIFGISRKFFKVMADGFGENDYDYNYYMDDIINSVLETKEEEVEEVLTEKFRNKIKKMCDNQSFNKSLKEHLFECCGKDCLSTNNIINTFSKLSENDKFNDILWKKLFIQYNSLDKDSLQKFLMQSFGLESSIFNFDFSKIIDKAISTIKSKIEERTSGYAESVIDYKYLKLKKTVDKK